MSLLKDQSFFLRLVRDGIVVMYVSFVLVVFKFFRVSFIQGRILYVYLEESPDVNYLLDLIDKICLAREMKDYWLEEELFAKLIFILRCPDVLFYVTRLREIVPAKPHPPSPAPAERKRVFSEGGMPSISLALPLSTELDPAKWKGVVAKLVSAISHSSGYSPKKE